MDPAPQLLIEVLRGDRSRRPVRDDTSAAGVRAALEDHVFEFFGAQRRVTPLIISSATLKNASPVSELSDSSLSRARGVLISTLLRLVVAHVHVGDPFDDALGAWRAERPGELVDLIDHLEHDQLARLRADVQGHFSTLLAGLGPIPSNWLPRTSQRARQLLGGGSVELRDVVDLVVGSIHSDSSQVALVDITTSPLGSGAERVVRYHAMMQTLRTGVAPLRSSIFSSATGDLWTFDVDAELLMHGVDDVARTFAHLKSHS
jgi:hypothetical protein